MEPNVNQVEHETLIRCLRPEVDLSTPTGPKPALPPGINWPSLQKAALAHGVFPSLYRWLADRRPEAVPPKVFQEWRRLYKINARQNLRKTTELLQVVKLLESHGVPAVPYKGPVLAALAYGDLARRQFVDLDLLVNRKDVGKVKELLVSQGYTSSYSLSRKQARQHLKYGVEFTFEHRRRTLLDVHWRFAADYLGGGLDPGEVMARQVPVQILGETVYTLHPEDDLLQLCQHGTFHSWLSLSTVSDVAYLIHSQNDWNWPRVLRRAQDAGLHRQVLLGLSLAREHLRAPVPGEVIGDAEADPAVAAVRRWVDRAMWERNGEVLGFFEQTFFYLRTRDCLKDKVRHVWCRLAMPTVEDWRWASLPDRLFGLYYVIRPLRLGWQGLVRPWMRRLKGLISQRWSRRSLASKSNVA